MIAEILNRDFVLIQMRAVLADLEHPADRRGDLPPIADELDDDDFALAGQALREASGREEAKSSGQVTSQPGGNERRGGSGQSLDDSVFISNDPVISLFQSALEDCLESRLPEVKEPPDGDRRSGLGTFSPVTDRSLGQFDEGRRLLGPFEDTDLAWAKCLFAMAIRRARGRHAFKAQPASAVNIADRARLVLVGDWGTGIPRAQRVGEQMRDVLAEGKSEGIEQHVIHLGDVYYSGWASEYEKRFLPFWPVRPDEASEVSSWALNGNHDMYSGGGGYFDSLLSDERFARQEGSSFFCLQNRHWQVLGLDTAYEDHGLQDPQAKWVSDRLVDDSRKVMLLSHHQLFSTDPAKGGPKLKQKLAAVLGTGKVTSWFWGHEHRCSVYCPHEQVAFASCIGHGGVPVYSHHKPGDPFEAPAKYEYFDSLETPLESWAILGFAVVDFNGPNVEVRYINEDGVKHHTETI